MFLWLARQLKSLYVWVLNDWITSISSPNMVTQDYLPGNSFPIHALVQCLLLLTINKFWLGRIRIYIQWGVAVFLYVSWIQFLVFYTELFSFFVRKYRKLGVCYWVWCVSASNSHQQFGHTINVIVTLPMCLANWGIMKNETKKLTGYVNRTF